MDGTIPAKQATLLDYWKVLRRYWLMIFVLVLLSVSGTWVWCKLSPRLYEAKATLLPAREQVGGGGISFSDKDKGGGGGMAMEMLTGQKSGPNTMEILHALLVSRTLAERMVKELNLLEYYGTTSLDLAIATLQSETDVRASPFKTYEVTVLTRDPQIGALIANTYVEQLDRLHKELQISSTKHHRTFLEARLAEKTKKLAEAEESLRAFQTEHRTISLTEETRAAMSAVADLHSQIVGLEVELAALRSYATPSHPQINQLEAQIAELRRQLDHMEKNQIQGTSGRRSRLPLSKQAFTEYAEAPALALDYLRLARQVKVEESVYGMLVGMLEQARIAESRDVPTIQQLDRAVPAVWPSRPRTMQNLQAAAALSLILGILLAFFLDYVKQLRVQDRVETPYLSGAGELLPEPNGSAGKVGAFGEFEKEPEHLHR
jgi:uncharacterized protein involved in exopolysaccharide biosynthesis